MTNPEAVIVRLSYYIIPALQCIKSICLSKEEKAGEIALFCATGTSLEHIFSYYPHFRKSSL